MIFLQPNYLWGLLAIAIPIIIHLFRFRRYKTVYFSSIAVLKAVKSETKKQSRLKHVLVLISRILAITMLVMAFARPVIPEKQGEGVTRGNRFVSVYIDNSLSMQIPGRDGMLLSQAREQALAIASSYSATDRFRLLTNDFNASRTRFTDRESFVNQVEGVTITSVTRRFEEVRQRLLAHDAPAETHKSYLISDFQKSTFNFDGLTPDSSASVTMVPLAGVKPANLYIDSCWFEKPSVQLMQTSNLKVLIRNSGQQDYEKIPLKLRIDGKQRALSSFSVAAGGKTEATLSFMNQQTGHREGLLEIEDSPITFDDTFYFSYQIHESTKVLEIYEEEPNLYLQRLFGRDSLIAFEAKNRLKLDYSRLGSYDLIVINGLEKVSTGLERMLQEIREKVDIVFIPSANAPETNSSILQAFNAGTIASLDTGNYEVAALSEKHPLLDNVFYKRPKSRQNEKYDLPSVKKYFRMSPSLETNVIMRLGNGNPFLTEKRERGHYLYALASPLNSDFTNFPQHPVFVPVFHRMAILSQKTGPLYYLPGHNNTIAVNAPPTSGEERILRLKKQGTAMESIPAVSRNNDEVFIKPFVDEPGHYRLMSDSTVLQTLAFNNDPLESELEVYSAEELQEEMKRVFRGNASVIEDFRPEKGSVFSDNERQRGLWRLFVWLTLLFLAAEVLLLRVLK